MSFIAYNNVMWPGSLVRGQSISTVSKTICINIFDQKWKTFVNDSDFVL